MKISLLFLISSIILLSNIYAQDDSIISVDHSKVTLSTDIVPQWKVQAELGGNYWYNEYDSYYYINGEKYTVTDHSLYVNNPSFAIRVGIIKNIELMVRAVFVQEMRFLKHEENIPFLFSREYYNAYAPAPLEAGIKIKFINEGKFLPSAAFNLNLYIPLENYHFNMDYVSPYFRLALQKKLGKKIHIGGNAAYGTNSYENFREEYGNYSLLIGGAISKRIELFAETFGYFQPKHTPDHRAAIGVSYIFARNVLAVVSGGFGFSVRAPDSFASVGIGFMFP